MHIVSLIILIQGLVNQLRRQIILFVFIFGQDRLGLSLGLSPMHADCALNPLSTGNLDLATPDQSKIDLILFASN